MALGVPGFGSFDASAVPTMAGAAGFEMSMTDTERLMKLKT